MHKNGCLLPRVAIWLVPRQAERDILQALIADLAGRFSAPAFVPHVTIYSCRRSPRQKELTLTAALARHCPPLTLAANGIASTDRLTRALYINLSSGKMLDRLRSSLQNELRQTSAGRFEPHISLLYQVIPEFDRIKLAGEVSLPFDEICFDQIWAVAIPEAIKCPEHLIGWQMLLSCRLDFRAITDKIEARRFSKNANSGK